MSLQARNRRPAPKELASRHNPRPEKTQCFVRRAGSGFGALPAAVQSRWLPLHTVSAGSRLKCEFKICQTMQPDVIMLESLSAMGFIPFHTCDQITQKRASATFKGPGDHRLWSLLVLSMNKAIAFWELDPTFSLGHPPNYLWGQ